MGPTLVGVAHYSITSSLHHQFFSIPNADLGAYNEVVQLAANFPQLFSPTHSQAKNEMDMQFWHHAYIIIVP